MLSIDEHVGHGSLARDILEGVLGFGAIGHRVQLVKLELDIAVLEELLGLLGEGAAALGVDEDLLGSDFVLDGGAERVHNFIFD